MVSENKRKNIEKRIQEVISEIRPAIQMDGGDVELVRYQPLDKVVVVRMSGACQGCALSSVTLKGGLETMIKERIPEIREVVTEDEL